MIKTFLLSCISVIILVQVHLFYSGTTLPNLIHPMALGIIILSSIPLLLLAGLSKDFFRSLLVTPAKIKRYSLLDLRNAHEAVSLVITSFLFFGVLLSLSAIIVFAYNFQNQQLAGPNLFGSLISLLYASLFALILLPVKLRIKKMILTFMEEDLQGLQDNSEKTMFSIKTVLVTLLSFFGIIALPIVFISFTLLNEQDIFIPFDPPTILLLALFLLSALFSSGILSEVLKRTRKNSSEILVLQKKILVLDFSLQVLVLSSMVITILGFIGILSNLEDPTALVPNTYLSLLAIFYALGIVIIMLPLRSSLQRKVNIRVGE